MSMPTEEELVEQIQVAKARLDHLQRQLRIARIVNAAASPGRKPAVHGSDGGYFAHLRGRNGFTPDPCDPCRAAHAQAARDLRARRSA